MAEQIDTHQVECICLSRLFFGGSKIEKVIRTSSSTKSDLEFRYNPMGERICKIVKPRSGSGLYNQDHWTYTYYMRDASGNVISTYERKFTTPATYYYDQLTLKEENLYGSSRVGVKNDTLRLMYVKYTYVSTASNIYSGTFSSRTSTVAPTTSFVHALGRKSYELVNHLGNVLVTVSDMRTANHNPLGGPVITSFNAVVNSATDYYAFGSPMEGRNYSSSSYRYGFNGKEKLDEMHNNSGDEYDFGARIYDARLGRFLSLDNFQHKSPQYSPYSYAGDSPLFAVDIDGDSVYILTYVSGYEKAEDNEMFEAAALTRKYDIEHSGHFDSKRDIVLVIEVQDMSDVVAKTNEAVAANKDIYGSTVEFSVYSHAGYDGPIGSKKCQKYNLQDETGINMDQDQMSMEGWSQINFNWSSTGNNRACFFGCNTGKACDLHPVEFNLRISELDNFKNVTVMGQTTSSYPSDCVNQQEITISQYYGYFLPVVETRMIPQTGEKFDTVRKTYLVGAEDPGVTSLLWGTSAEPMSGAKNGKMLESKSYQNGTED